MEKAEKHIVLEYSDQLPESIPRSMLRSLVLEDFNVDIVKRETRVFASLEWFLPTAIAVYFTKPFFEEFFRRAGKKAANFFHKADNETNEKYHPIYKWLIDQLEMSKGIEVKVLSNSENKNKPSNSQSKVFSIIVQLNNSKSLKCLFDTEHDKETSEGAINQLLSLLHEHYNGLPGDEICSRINDLSQIDPSYITIFEEGNWIIYDQRKLALRSRFEKIKNIIESVRHSVRQYRLDEALEELGKTFEFSKYKTQILSLDSRHSKLRNSKIMGELSSEHITLEENKITNSIIELLELIEEDFRPQNHI